MSDQPQTRTGLLSAQPLIFVLIKSSLIEAWKENWKNGNRVS